MFDAPTDGPLPRADVYVLGHIPNDRGPDGKRRILDEVADAVNEGGAVIVHGTMIDDERRENGTGPLMGLDMLVETPDGFDYTHGERTEWLRGAGSADPTVEGLPGPESITVAHR
ncbi:MAG: methyltransferase [Haloferacaceae archaeon]